MADELDDLLERVRARYTALPVGSDARRHVQDHLRSLARWNAEPSDYPVVDEVAFPGELTVAFAVCHPECGVREFIVDGSTQECQYCGGLLYRTETQKYEIARPGRSTGSSRGTA